MNPTEIEFAVKDLVAKAYDPETFPFDLIATYNAPKITVSKLKSGQTNAATLPGDVLWKKHLFFRSAATTDDVASIADALIADPLTAKHKPRFILVTNGDQVHIRDLKLDETCNSEFARLDEFSDFILPLAGFERRAAIIENPADVKAAKRLAKLYNSILTANPIWSDGNHTHELNLFMTRILFCFYAEDTGIFDTPQVFSGTVVQQTKEDGSDVAALLDRLFRIMNIEEGKRPARTPAVDARFPYVNGSLFEATLPIPDFNRTARRLFLECGELDWKTINPDIFGSMIQTVAEPGSREDIGMHYTSVPNIMKVLQPLFLDELNEAYEKAKDGVVKLESLLARLAKIRVFDPACGSGNFLVIAYKELRQIEMRILSRIGEIAPKNPLRLSGVSLHNFFGIDFVDFACETAKLSLWIGEYQMNSAFKELFGTTRPALPLGKISTIHFDNATRLNWFDVCPQDENAETYICGNPPYHGTKYQTEREKEDLAYVFASITPTYRELDYVTAWVYKAAEYVKSTISAHSALVATNSICQGTQVPLLWPLLLNRNLTIAFAHTSFKWSNNASNNAGITCIVVGLSTSAPSQRRIYTNDHIINCAHIGPYLIPSANDLVVTKPSANLSDLPPMVFGNKATDGGHLILSPREKQQLLREYPEAFPLIWRLYGSQEFIQGIERWTLWISDNDLSLANRIPPIAKRLAAVKASRLASPDAATNALAAFPHRYQQIRVTSDSLIVPHTCSERRQYLTVGLMTSGDIVLAPAFAVYNPPGYLLAILSSRLHYIWAMTIGGHLESRLRYSNSLVYNSFPISGLSNEQQRVLSDHSKAILRARAKHPGKTIAWLYNPETMPTNLLETHQENDAYMEECIYGRVFKDDTQRLERLFSMYAIIKTRGDAPLLAAGSPKKVRN